MKFKLYHPSLSTFQLIATRGFFDRSLRRILKDQRGATAVELGLIAVPLFMSLFAVFEVGYGFFLRAALDHAAQTGARAVLTGAVSTAGLSSSQFQSQIICPALPSLINCSNIFINMSIVPQSQSPSGYYSYVSADMSGLIQPPLDNSQTTFCPGSGSQYIVLQLLYPAPFLTAFFSAGATTTFNGQKVHVLMSTTTFKTEPYSGAQTYSGC